MQASAKSITRCGFGSLISWPKSGNESRSLQVVHPKGPLGPVAIWNWKRMKSLPILSTLLVLLFSTGAMASLDLKQGRGKKVLRTIKVKEKIHLLCLIVIAVISLFNVIKFKNGPCLSTSSLASSGSGSTHRNGTCMTDSECSDRSGVSSGGCASG